MTVETVLESRPPRVWRIIACAATLPASFTFLRSLWLFVYEFLCGRFSPEESAWAGTLCGYSAEATRVDLLLLGFFVLVVHPFFYLWITRGKKLRFILMTVAVFYIAGLLLQFLLLQAEMRAFL